jgi:selenocysteine-specific elongation factor
VYVIGTAGHVDHGKSTLIQALTGIHPDRLREEQERGMTIELGFAWMTLPSGREVSIVDVPGHVRFVRHMLAGIGAVDLALLVVAADEGVMPQTREHLAILDLLEIRRALLVLTKCDLVEDDWAALVAEEALDLVAATSLGRIPAVRVSAATGEGLEALTQAIDAALDEAPEPRDIGRPRLGIDRVFTMPGFGTVVTGTLLDGRFNAGDAVEVTPGGPTARIRSLQTHRRDVEEARPGSRVAVNLSGVDVAQLRRGQVVARPGRMSAVTAFDARLRALEGADVKHNLRVSVHAGSDEAQGRVRVLGADRIEGGGEGWVQVVLREPLAAVPGDLFVLRVSDSTLGGGRIVEVNPPRHRRQAPATIARLEARATGTPEARLLAALERLQPATATALRGEVELDAAQAGTVLEALLAEGAVRALPVSQGEPLLLTAAALRAHAEEVRRALEAYHAAHPLRFAMPREEVRSRLRLGQREFNAILGALEGLVARADGIAEAGWAPRPSPAQQRAIDEARTAIDAGGLQPPRLRLDPEVLAHLEGAGAVVDCGDGVMLSVAAFDEARRRIGALFAGRERISLAEARDALDTNRRAAQAILETFDRRGITRRVGDERVLV